MPGLRHPILAITAFALLAAGCCVAQSPSPTNPLPVITSHASDSYAIYSLLLSAGGESNRTAIADTTVNADDMHPATEPDSELQPPPDNQNAFYQAVQDFRARHQERAQLQHRFKVDRPYTLVSAPEVEGFGKSASGGDSGLQGTTSITRFSQVYFNAAQNAALVYTDSVCANPCANGQWIYLEKRDSQWVRRSSSVADPADIYAIYSLLLRDDPYPGLPQKQGQLAIADTTVNITDMNPAIAPDSELQAPPNNVEAFREAVQDFHARRYERLQLKRDFHLDVDYALLSSGEVATYKSAQTGYPAINFFSEVYFDSKQTAALVYRNTFCGRLCANSQWIFLEKKGDQWVRRSGLNI
jgi:hypothetical protein